MAGTAEGDVEALLAQPLLNISDGEGICHRDLDGLLSARLMALLHLPFPLPSRHFWVAEGLAASYAGPDRRTDCISSGAEGSRLVHHSLKPAKTSRKSYCRHFADERRDPEKKITSPMSCIAHPPLISGVQRGFPGFILYPPDRLPLDLSITS